MKKVIYVLLLTVIGKQACAQSQHGGTSYGFNFGLSPFTVTHNPYGKSLPSYTGGIYVSFPLSKQLYLQPELNFRTQNTKSSANLEAGNIPGTAKLNMSYINVPVLVKYNLTKTNFSFYAGPQVGFLTGGKVNQSGSSFDIREGMRKIDFSGTYGIEYYFPVNNKNAITLNARYTTGFTDILKRALVLNENNGKNKGYSITVGLRW